MLIWFALMEAFFTPDFPYRRRSERHRSWRSSACRMSPSMFPLNDIPPNSLPILRRLSIHFQIRLSSRGSRASASRRHENILCWCTEASACHYFYWLHIYIYNIRRVHVYMWSLQWQQKCDTYRYTCTHTILLVIYNRWLGAFSLSALLKLLLSY